MVQFLVIGQHQSGKTSLTKRFLRRYCVHKLENPARKWEHPSDWSVEYHKKDVTFWHSNDSVGSARVQLWDVTGGGPSDKPLQRRQEWIRLAQKMSGIVLVLSLEHGSDVLLETIVSWKHWLDDCCPTLSRVHLFLQKCDLLPNVDPVVWMHLGSRISSICDEIGIIDWRLTTCCEDREEQSPLLPENAIMELVRSIAMTEALQRRNQRRASPVVSYVEQSRAKSGSKFVTDSTQTVLEAEAVPIT
jgi:GTPase SAR1 family protein